MASHAGLHWIQDVVPCGVTRRRAGRARHASMADGIGLRCRQATRMVAETVQGRPAVSCQFPFKDVGYGEGRVAYCVRATHVL